jgi:hypothetical protein
VSQARIVFCAPAVAMVLATGCGAAAPTPTAIPAATETAVHMDLSVTVPKGEAPQVEGRISSEEWATAHEESLEGGGSLLLMHDGDNLYIALRAKPDSLGSICLARGDTVAVLHSSMGVGTAEYERTEDGYRRTRGFTWTWWDRSDRPTAEQQAEFFQNEGWVASTVGQGNPGEMEYQIDWSAGPVRIGVIYFAGTDNEVMWWPAQLSDTCRSKSLIQGYPPVVATFQPQQWVALATAGAN